MLVDGRVSKMEMVGIKDGRIHFIAISNGMRHSFKLYREWKGWKINKTRMFNDDFDVNECIAAWVETITIGMEVKR